MTEYTVTPVSFSDHGLVTCTVAFDTYSANRNSGTRWLMSSTVLKSEAFIEKVQDEIETLRSGTMSVEKWENFKARIKRFAITTGREEATRKKEKTRRLTETLCALIQADEERPGEFREDIWVIKEELRGELKKGYWGALVRSREQRVKLEARPSKLFAAFEREHTARKTIMEVKHPAGIATGSEVLK